MLSSPPRQAIDNISQTQFASVNNSPIKLKKPNNQENENTKFLYEKSFKKKKKKENKWENNKKI